MRFVFILLLFLQCFSSASAADKNHEFVRQISALETKNTGRLGVAVISATGAPLFSYRNAERFAMCSTFKALLVAAILSRVDKQSESLDRPISYQASDLLEYAPIAKEQLTKGQMTVAELSAATLQHSDNTAANLLLQAIGGPVELTDFLRSIGDDSTRSDRNEPALNSNLPGDLRDTSTPKAMTATLQKILVGNALSPASRERLKTWMFGNLTGDTKLRAGFNPSWMVGDKTGSGANGASNDVAIVFPTGLPAFIIAVFYTASTSSSEEKNAVIAQVARITQASLLNQRK
jgi:beta-lactamase class A